MARHFLPHVKKQSKRLGFSLAAGIGYILCGMLEPWPLKMIFDNVFWGEPLPALASPFLSNFQDRPLLLLNILIGSIILIAIVRGVFYYWQQLLTSRAGQQTVTAVRLDLYRHLQSLSFSFHDRRRTGDMLARLTTDIRILRDILISLPLTVTSELLLMAGMLTVMALMDWQLTAIALTAIPMLAVLIKKYRFPMKEAIRVQREREGHLTSLASETLGAIKVVQGFHQETYEVNRFSSQNTNSLKSGLKATRLEAKLKWASELAVATVTAVVIGVAGHRVISGLLTPGDLLVFTFYLRMFNRPLRRVSRMTEQMARGTASGERILDLLNLQPEITNSPGAVEAPPFHGRIEYENVSLHYKRLKPVVETVSFTIEAGERVGLVGHTGSGKTSVASLLPRFYDPSAGCVKIDGMDIRSFTLESLRKQIAFVFQEPVLFAATIEENIAYGKPGAGLEEVVDAAKKVRIHEMILSLPDGYETVIGERGGTLSGGQRQCVSIARAMIKDAPIVILDEPTSGLDTHSAHFVMQALKELMKNRTVIVISHRGEALEDMDHIITMNQGRLVEEKEAVPV
jgi:ATP-binding cassette, subfamily B, bacterial